MILKNVSLKKYNTFGLDYKTDQLITFKTEEEAISILKEGKSLKDPLFIIGRGSNLLFTGDYKGTVLHSEIGGITIEERHNSYVIVSAGAGMIWDKFVEWSVDERLGGLENLSLIPGMVGASPVQNIGAYGVEVKDTIEKVRAVSVEDGSLIEFSKNDCRFDYRNSIFKNEFKGKYLITKVYFKLTTTPIFKLDYGSLYLELKEPGNINLKSIREAVINIRRAKLPDPELICNAGSFFKNPVVSSSTIKGLKESNPQMPAYEDPKGDIKLAAGWLIDQCGWKGKRIGDAGVHEKQALVLINHGNATGEEIYNLSEAIRMSVHQKFGIDLEREVEVVGTI
ncbi:MAG TPA: UDP-N-acetylmuramate dehydrogenase [Bacteroidales bacterium]|nr:UDP-N-acetylmuramate dehydrogenase [Bacteroidales bacterium]